MNFHLPDSTVTEALGRALARAIPGAGMSGAPPRPGAGVGAAPAGLAVNGAVVFLHGELGAGKTTCGRSLLRTLGITGLVRSPTYTLVETYVLSALTCIHVDLYRLQSLTEVDELGLRDLLGPRSLLLVEWPDKGRAALPPPDLELSLSYAGDARLARLSADTVLGQQWLLNLGYDNSLMPYVSNLT